MLRRLLVLLVLLAASNASAEDLGAARAHAAPADDSGFRLHAAVGYPSITAVGFGWKAGRTEVLAQVGGLGVWAFLAGTAEASVSYDFFRRPWGALHSGLAFSLLHAHGFAIDCYEGESCEDFIQNLYFASPRLGTRLRLDRRKQHGAIPYLELAAGPQIGLCRGECEHGDVVVNAAVQMRFVLDWASRN